MNRRSIHVIAFIFGFLIFLIDFLSKYWIQLHLPQMNFYPFYPYGGIGVFENFFGIEFSITHAINRGAAWGIFSQWQDYLIFVRLFMVFGIFIYLYFFNKRPFWEIPFAIIIAGALGNIVDYFLYGHVIDMFHFVFWGYDYPVFNVADASIFIGIVWLFILSWQEERKYKIS